MEIIENMEAEDRAWNIKSWWEEPGPEQLESSVMRMEGGFATAEENLPVVNSVCMDDDKRVGLGI